MGMLRQMMMLAVDAVRVEINRRRDPGEEQTSGNASVASDGSAMLAQATTTPARGLEEAGPSPPAPKPPSRWGSPAYHVEVLASTECPDCGAAKGKGSYRCPPCIEEVRRAG